MNKNILIGAVVAIFLVIAIFQTVQIYNIKDSNKVTGNAVSSGSIDTSTMTENEKMNYEMHGTIPARLLSGSAQNNPPQQVGSC